MLFKVTIKHAYGSFEKMMIAPNPSSIRKYYELFLNGARLSINIIEVESVCIDEDDIDIKE